MFTILLKTDWGLLNGKIVIRSKVQSNRYAGTGDKLSPAHV